MDVFAVIRYGSGKEDLVAVFSTFDKARAFIRESEEVDEKDYDIEQHTVDEPERSAP